MWLNAKDFRAHMANDEKEFADNKKQNEEIANQLRKHNNDVKEKHTQNMAAIAQVAELSERTAKSVVNLTTTVNNLNNLRPDIEKGIKADQDLMYRKMLFKRVVLAIISTLVFVSGLIPLVQLLMSAHFSVHFGKVP